MFRPEDIRIAHPQDYGRVLVGSAILTPACVQWIGAVSPTSFICKAPPPAFGMTGPSVYVGEPAAPNQWVYQGTADFSTIGNPLPSGISPSMGHFFAPDKAGRLTLEHSYEAQGNYPAVTKAVPVSGEGIEDDAANPILKLEVLTKNTAPQGQEIKLAARGGVVTFQVIPRVDTNRLPAGIRVNHVFVELVAQNVNIPGAMPLRETAVTANSFIPNDYYHYLESSPPHMPLSGSTRSYAFLVSVNKPFEFQVAAQEDTGGGHVKYLFFIRGHYDPRNPTKWPGSHQTFQVSASGQIAIRKVDWPAMGHASYLDAKGQVREIQAVSISGGIEIEGKGVQRSGASFKRMEDVNIGARIQVHHSHKGKPVDKLVVMAYQANPSAPMSMNCQLADGSFKPWDGQIPNLLAKASETLGDTLDFSMFDGPFSQPAGVYTLFMGYRMSDGSVMFNGSAPLTFTVTP